MRTELMSVGPQQAKMWIQATGEQNYRRTDNNRIALLTRVMERGEWSLNGESIKLNGSIVLDGMHRLHAIVRSGCTIKTLVVFDVDKQAVSTMDRGRPRTMGQELAHRGIPNAAKVASILRSWFLYRQGAWTAQDLAGPALGRVSTDAEMLAFLDENKSRILDATRMCDLVEGGGVASASLLVRTIGGVILAEGTMNFDLPHDSDQACEYMRALRSGGTGERDPLTHLRNRLIANKSSHTKMSFGMKAALAIHAWNLFCKGESVSTLHYRLSGPTRRAFPIIEQADV